VVKFCITRPLLEYHVYANCIEFINLYYVIWRRWKHWYQLGASSAGIS